ncbi:uncharacterized protein LOC110988986 [Acanthaster planci]|uniref:Uncharacterized protein LOC110988986 n=1 Tax=Acanthaster planci TaxID=133434 RepID=A0A8B7ZUE7_ACAPL|nr:uncharacterized protein LOC110988986 [Acanthaster planci]
MRLSSLMFIIFLAIFCSPATATYRIISFEDYCPQSACTILEDQSGELQISFSQLTSFRQCALVFAASHHHDHVFLSLVPDPLECRGFALHIYDGRTYATKSELSVGGICTNVSASAPKFKYRSFMTSGREFSIVLERKVSVASRGSRVSFTMYYRAFDEESILIQDICHMCHENKTNELGMEVCEGLLPNCTGITQVIKGSCLAADDEAKRRRERTEAFGILMAGAVIFTIIFVALHCGGENHAIKVRAVAPIEPARHAQASAIFATRAGTAGRSMTGPIVHV